MTGRPDPSVLHRTSRYDALHARAEEALLDAAGQPLACSPITLAEVLVGPARREQLDVARAAIDELEVEVIPFEEDAPVQLARLRAIAGLKLPDCCVLLAATTTAAERILTSDDALERAAERLLRDLDGRPSLRGRQPAGQSCSR